MPQGAIAKILFAGYSRAAFSTIVPTFPLLIEKGINFAFLSGYLHPPTPEQLRGLVVFSPPLLMQGDAWMLSRTSGSDMLSAILKTGVIPKVLHRLTRNSQDLRQAVVGWQNHYFAFAEDTLKTYKPDLVILSIGGVDPQITAWCCRRQRIRYGFMLSQVAEFKYVTPLFVSDRQAFYIVSGEFGRRRLAAAEVPGEKILIVGSPRFDELFEMRKKLSRQARPCQSPFKILYTTQGILENKILFEHLTRYLEERENVHLLLRPHPAPPPSPAENPKRYVPLIKNGIAARVSISAAGPLIDQLICADILVSVSSLTMLEALILSVPVVSWKSVFFPDEIPFGASGDALQAFDYPTLRKSLDQLLFEPSFRESWQISHKNSFLKYISHSDGKASLRVVETFESQLALNKKIRHASPV